MMATNIATPTAIAAWRIMLITPEPVANEDGGSDDALIPMSVGNVSPTPTPAGTMPKTIKATLGSGPVKTAQTTCPAAKHTMPAVITGAAPNRRISLPASSSEVVGTSSGPGAIASPVFSADHPQTVCSHTAIENSMAPKA